MKHYSTDDYTFQQGGLADIGSSLVANCFQTIVAMKQKVRASDIDRKTICLVSSFKGYEHCEYNICGYEAQQDSLTIFILLLSLV